MRNWRYIIFGMIAVPAVLGFLNGAYAQSLQTEHTYKLNDVDHRPKASLVDVKWLVGSWTGDAFGNRFEEVWNPPSAGSIVGMFKLMDEDQNVFYELMLVVEEEGSLSLKVKHFNEDLTAWEEKEDYVRFRLVKFDDDAVHFSGLSFHRVNEDEIHAFIALHHEGQVREEKLVYRRND